MRAQFSADALRRATVSVQPRAGETSTAAVIVGVIIASFCAALVLDVLFTFFFLLVILLGGPSPLPRTAFPMTHWSFAAILFLIWFFKRRKHWLQGIAIWVGGYFLGSVINALVVTAIWGLKAGAALGLTWSSGGLLLVGGAYSLMGLVLLWLGFAAKGRAIWERNAGYIAMTEGDALKRFKRSY